MTHVTHWSCTQWPVTHDPFDPWFIWPLTHLTHDPWPSWLLTLFTHDPWPIWPITHLTNNLFDPWPVIHNPMVMPPMTGDPWHIWPVTSLTNKPFDPWPISHNTLTHCQLWLVILTNLRIFSAHCFLAALLAELIVRLYNSSIAVCVSVC